MKRSSLIYSFFKALFSLGLLLILDWRFDGNIFDEYIVFISLVFLCGSITNLNLMYSSQIHYEVSDDIKRYFGIFAYRIMITLIAAVILKLLGYSNIILLFLAISSKAIGDILTGYFRNRLEFNYGSLLIFSQILITLVVVLFLPVSSCLERVIFLLIMAELLPPLFVVMWLIILSKTDWSLSLKDIIFTGLSTIPFTLILPVVSNLRTQQLYNTTSIENAVNYSLSFKMATPVMLACGILLNYSIQSFKKNVSWQEFKLRLRDLLIVGLLSTLLVLSLISTLNASGLNWWQTLSFSGVSLESLISTSIFLVVLALSTFLNQTLVFLNFSMVSYIFRYLAVLVCIVGSIYLIQDNLIFGITIIAAVIFAFVFGSWQVKKYLV